MTDLVLEQKTGFSSILPFEIFDITGQLFYSSDFTEHIAKGERLNFNLPAGSYKYNGSFIKLEKPVPVKNVTLPMRERNIAKKDYQIIFGNNKNKCTIFYETGIILFDSSLKNMPMFYKYGIYFHELGHHWYKSEQKADLYSVKIMLEKGFNPSQIGKVALNTLSEKSYQRKMRIVNLLTNNKG